MLTEKVVLDNVIKYVRTMLGDKTVEVELTRAELLTLIEQALRKLRPYYSGVRYVQANGKQIDVSNHDPIAVSRVWNAGDIQYNTIQDIMFGGVGLMIYDINFMQRFEMMKAYQMLWNELSNQKGENFRLLNNTIYLDGYLDNALIEMTVNLKTITDVEESSMYADWILDYTLALAKEVLGRKRGKATLQGSPIQLDAAQLLSEAASEKTHLEDQLVGDIYVY
ncbi:MAG: hypothetical protein IJF92_00570 [Bacilli bacterium]|nr:hypothetical protein [Bacilli bacterium]MBQ3307692.1 hypothetical protein [Bacilli bacterium]